jgi:hypothetical protein
MNYSQGFSINRKIKSDADSFLCRFILLQGMKKYLLMHAGERIEIDKK